MVGCMICNGWGLWSGDKRATGASLWFFSFCDDKFDVRIWGRCCCECGFIHWGSRFCFAVGGGDGMGSMGWKEWKGESEGEGCAARWGLGGWRCL